MRLVALSLALVAVAGCGGGGSSLPIVPKSNSPAMVQKKILLSFPGTTQPGYKRISHYVSRNTQGVGVSFGATPATFPANTTPTAAFDVSSASSLCTAGSNGARTCTLTVGVPAGTDDFQITAWDAVPTSNAFPAPANALSSVSILSQTVSSGANTAINVVMNGVVNAFNFTVSPATLSAGPTVANGGTAQTATLSANALDADGNIILGNGNYVDANGNTLTVGVTQSATSNGGSSVTTLSSTSFTPAAATATITYPGGNSWGTVFTPSITGGTVPGAQSSATLNITPTVTLFPVPTASSSPSFITAGPTGDSNMYFTENLGNQIGRISTTSGAIAEAANSSFNTLPVGITAGTDGNVWYDAWTANNNATIDYLTPSTFTTTVVASENPAGSQFGLADGHDGYMYMAEASVSDVTRQQMPSGLNGFYTTSSSPYGLIYGPDGNIWIADQGGNVQTLSTGASPAVGTAIAVSGTPTALAVGSDGNIWCAAHGNIDMITIPGHVASAYNVPLSLGSSSGIASGSDGALWFTGSTGIGRMTTSGTLTSYFAGFSASDDPTDIKQGPDGSLWFVEPNANKIGRLIY